MRNLNCVLLSMLFLFVPMAALAGDLDSPAEPTEAASAMYTLEDIYNRLNAGTAGAKRPGAFTEPSAGPAPTGHTLNEVMAKAPSVDSANGAGVADVLATKTFWGLKTGGWGLRIGTMPTNTLSAANDTVVAGYYAATTLSAVDPDLAGGNIVSGKTIFGKAGSAIAATGNAEAGDVLTGHTFSKTGAAGVSGTMTNNGAGSTITPGTSDQTLVAGYWSSANTVSGDTDLVTGNIKSGETIFGVAGKTEVVDTTEATNPVAAARMKTDDVAFVNGTKITGSGTKVLSAANDTVSAGYYAATTLSTVDGDLAAGNIKKDVAIFGVTGTYEGGSAYPAPVPKTGQTPTVPLDPAPAWSDGALQKGVLWPDPRFTDNNDETVTDNLTGLMWAKNASPVGQKNWNVALTYCNNLSLGGHTDWRLPNVRELLSLVDFGQCGPAFPSVHPFTNFQPYNYWTSTTYAKSNNTTKAWRVNLFDGGVNVDIKDYSSYVWPVRAGQ